MKRRYDLLLVDADETLLDFKSAERAALTETLARYGVRADEDIVRCYSVINEGLWKQLERGEITATALRAERFRRLFSALGLETDCAVTAQIYTEALSGQPQLLPGAEAFCRELHAELPLYIITNGLSEVQRRRIGASPIAPYVDGLFISEELGAPKPEAAYFDAVCATLASRCPDRRRMLIVGDSPTSDLAGARTAGIDAAWFNPEGKPLSHTVEGNGVHIYEIRALSEVRGLVFAD